MFKIIKLPTLNQYVFSFLNQNKSTSSLYRFSSTVQLQGTINLNNLKTKPLIDQKINNKHYDVAIIGGGSGGLAFALEASKHNLKTVVFDYVEQSTQGNTWGLGGTCVNVGCIPKKLMHTSGLYKEILLNSPGYGFDLNQLNEGKLDSKHFIWENLVQNVQSYIKSINFGYKKQLVDKNIDYVNALATFYDKNTLVFSPKSQHISSYLQDNNLINQEKQEDLGKITADQIVIAVGGRPLILPDEQCKNSYKYGITSDDIFMQKCPPRKTLVVGGGYIAVECAGFLSTLGYHTSMMTRQLYLREFDQDIAYRIVYNLQKENGVNIVPTSLPSSIEKVDENLFKVKIVNQVTQQETEDYKGRFENELEQNKDINCVYFQKLKLDVNDFPTTIFTPTEYSCTGLSEEQSIKKYGEENIEVYHSKYTPLEEQISPRYDEDYNSLQRKAYAKIICNKLENDKIVGIHYLGPNAGEVMQGYAVAMKLGTTKFDLDRTIGIHPTTSEEFTGLNITKSSGEPYEKTSC
ncbi:thioredoxin reductase, putative [Ichthyophthirius multifiliis]|uniref:Thioredoxin reductase, putative n=1 Tax=Ichthyophthirius multifiliis TaxID=5932 RepID=G0R5G6_ICHMU|nr:thioredoxin reductase, putative [Ichthyophthirius multifiliis]EGR27288.1 thioredoxin reductase, putative [Ichthyophthirius multifiliis]|eukprot:XP_004024172.1 thioredoxin reductase, putative [Ichthyophthirius multifiliis]